MAAKKKEAKGVRDDIDKEDEEEGYYRYMEENPNAGLSTIPGDGENEEGEIDEQGNEIVSVMKDEVY